VFSFGSEESRLLGTGSGSDAPGGLL